MAPERVYCAFWTSAMAGEITGWVQDPDVTGEHKMIPRYTVDYIRELEEELRGYYIAYNDAQQQVHDEAGMPWSADSDPVVVLQKKYGIAAPDESEAANNPAVLDLAEKIDASLRKMGWNVPPSTTGDSLTD